MNKVHEIVTEKILNALGNGIIPWRKPWQSKLPCNFESKRTYSGINLFLLALSPFACPYWLTLKQISKMGGKLIKGERSTLVVFWKLEDRKDKDGVERKIPFLRYYKVFNLEQTTGIDIPKEEAIDFNPIEECESLTKSYLDREAIPLVNRESQAYYSPVTDVINMPRRETFINVPSYYATLFHEIAHSTGHKRRLDRLEKTGFGSGPYAKEELVAELTSAFFCADFGIDNSVFDNSVAYIQAWMKRLKEDPALIIESSSKARKAYQFITEGSKCLA
jgi:antirestriction protein ArdC